MGFVDKWMRAILLGTLLLLPACTRLGIKKIKSSQFKFAVPEGYQFKPIGFGLESSSVTRDGSALIANIDSGRMQGFQVTRINESRAQLTCSSLPARTTVQDSIIWVDSTFLNSATDSTADCLLDGFYNVQLRLSFNGSDVAIVSQGLEHYPGRMNIVSSKYGRAMSEDGNVTLVVAVGGAQKGAGLFQLYAYIHDLDQFRLVSADASNVEANTGVTGVHTVSSDGRYVAFTSDSTVWVAGVGAGLKIYRKDLITGSLELASKDAVGTFETSAAGFGSIDMSSDGRYIAYSTNNSTLVGGVTGLQVYRKDMQTGAVVVASSTSAGVASTGGTLYSHVKLSADGQSIAFHTDAGNLVPGVSGRQAYLKNLQSGAITAISTITGGSTYNNDNTYFEIFSASSDLRYVLFRSAASTFPGHNGWWQCYRKDTVTGILDLVSTNTAGVSITSSGIDDCSVSADGNKIAIATLATNWSGGTSVSQVYLKSMSSGTLDLVSKSSSGAAADAEAMIPSISADGKTLVFMSHASNIPDYHPGQNLVRVDTTTLTPRSITKNLIGGYDSTYTGILTVMGQLSEDANVSLFRATNGSFDSKLPMTFFSLGVYAKNMTTGQVTRISADATGASIATDVSSFGVSGNGQYAIFSSAASNVISGVTGSHVYRKNILTGAVDLVTANASGTAGTIAGASTQGMKLDRTGRFAAFSVTGSSGLISGISGNQVYKKDLQTGAITLVSSTAAGVQSDTSTTNSYVAMTPDARYVAFISANATNLVAGASGAQVYRKDTLTGAIDLASVTAGGTSNTTSVLAVSISDDGNLVSFLSTSPVLGSGNSSAHLYVKNISTGSLTLVSTNSSGTIANNAIATPSGRQMSADGTYVVFTTLATNLIAGLPAVQQTFRKNLQTGWVELVSSNSSGAAVESHARVAAISADGKHVLFGYDGNNYIAKTNPIAGISGRQYYLKKMP